MKKYPRYLIRKDKVAKWQQDTPSTYVDDTTPKHSDFRRKPTKFVQYAPICEKCKQVIPLSGECDFCGHKNTLDHATHLPLVSEPNV